MDFKTILKELVSNRYGIKQNPDEPEAYFFTGNHVTHPTGFTSPDYIYLGVLSVGQYSGVGGVLVGLTENGVNAEILEITTSVTISKYDYIGIFNTLTISAQFTYSFTGYRIRIL